MKAEINIYVAFRSSGNHKSVGLFPIWMGLTKFDAIFSHSLGANKIIVLDGLKRMFERKLKFTVNGWLLMSIPGSFQVLITVVFSFVDICDITWSNRLCPKSTNHKSCSAKTGMQSNAICEDKAVQFVSECPRTAKTSGRGEEGQGSEEGGCRRLAMRKSKIYTMNNKMAWLYNGYNIKIVRDIYGWRLSI